MRNAVLAGASAILLLAAAVAGHYVGQWWEGEQKPPRPVVIDTTMSDRTIPQPEPVKWPDKVTLYAPVETTAVETVRMPVPIDMEMKGVIGQRPITREDRWFGADRLQLTYFDPSRGPSGGYVRESYSLPKPRWQVRIDAGVETTASLVPATRGRISGLALRPDVKAWLRYRRLRGYVGAGLRGAEPIGMVGIRTRILSYSWD
jgi:hypothetical protein